MRVGALSWEPGPTMLRKGTLIALAFLTAVVAGLAANGMFLLVDADPEIARRAGETAFVLTWGVALVLIVQHFRHRRPTPQPTPE